MKLHNNNTHVITKCMSNEYQSNNSIGKLMKSKPRSLILHNNSHITKYQRNKLSIKKTK